MMTHMDNQLAADLQRNNVFIEAFINQDQDYFTIVVRHPCLPRERVTGPARDYQVAYLGAAQNAIYTLQVLGMYI